MNSGQKVIKVFALAFAIFLIISICSMILFGFTIMINALYPTQMQEVQTGTIIEQNVSNIEDLDRNVRLDIDLELSHLEIKIGDKFKIEKMNMTNHLECKVKGTTLKIDEKEDRWFGQSSNTNSTVILTIPSDIVFEKVNISMGIGKLNVSNMETKYLDLDTGMGVTKLENVTAQRVDIDGGAGNFIATNCDFENLDLDSGIGYTMISGDIRGNSKITCGVEKTELHLTREKEDYKIRVETGLGRMTFNGETCENNNTYGNGIDSIKIDGGVGEVIVTTK